ncbi:hypothetical protein CDEF62S_01920 [Castellaniella defragrans]
MARKVGEGLGGAMRGDFVFDLFQRAGRPEFIQELLRPMADPQMRQPLDQDQVPARHGHQQQEHEQRLADEVALAQKVQDPQPAHGLRGRHRRGQAGGSAGPRGHGTGRGGGLGPHGLSQGKHRAADDIEHHDPHLPLQDKIKRNVHQRLIGNPIFRIGTEAGMPHGVDGRLIQAAVPRRTLHLDVGHLALR